MFQRVTRPIRAWMMAFHFSVSYRYACQVALLADRYECGQLSDEQALRAGMQLGEHFPDDYAKAMHASRQ
jgi:hypothetical protein